MITVYGMSGTHVARVREALIQKGLKFEHVSVNLADISDEFKMLTPVGKIPVIKDSDGTVVWDSLHIVEYLDLKYPDTYEMLSNNPKTRAKMLNVVALAEKISGFFNPLYVEKFSGLERYRKSGMSHRAFLYDDAQKEDMRKDVANSIEQLAKMVDKNRYFVDDRLSHADVVVLSVLNTMDFMDLSTGPMKQWQMEMMKNPKVAGMNAPKDTKPIKEI